MIRIFQTDFIYFQWIEANFTNRLSFADLTIKPLQRLTRYKLLLEAIQKKTHDSQQKNDLHEMVQFYIEIKTSRGKKQKKAN